MQFSSVMANLIFWWFLLGVLTLVIAEELYATNFMEAFRWKSKQIHYGTPGRVSDVEFRNFVSNSINIFNDKFGNYFEWIFEEHFEDLKMHERYLVFDKRKLQFDDGCLNSWWSNTIKVYDEKMLLGQNTIWITVSRNNGKIACQTRTVLRLILATLGFYPLTARSDRDKHILFIPKRNVFIENIPKRFDLANSTNPIFKSFNFDSIHMPDSLTFDHNTPPWPPLFVPVNNNTKNWEDMLNSDKNITETDIKQFQAIYHD